MDFQKIFNLIAMILLAYLLYQNNSKETITSEQFTNESFENITLGSADDQNAINKLAQIATKLMEGSLTVPGNMTINGTTTINGALNPAAGVWHHSTDGKPRLHYGANSHTFYRTADAHVWRNNADQDKMVLDANGNLTVTGFLIFNPAVGHWYTSNDGKHRLHYGNNSHTFYKTADAHVWRNRDDTDRMVLDHGANLRVDGGLTVAGRNILAELDWIKGNMVKYRDVVRHLRRDSRWVRGDNTSDWDRGYSDWYILRENEHKNAVGL
jgi:hypothetical protein